MKILRYIFITVLLATASAPLCSFALPTDPCLLRGQVTDAITKKPVSGVTVSVVTATGSPRAAVTDREGFFYFRELPGCQVNLRFEKKGYVGYRSKMVSVKENSTLKLDVQVSPMSESFPEDSEFPLLRMLDEK